MSDDTRTWNGSLGGFLADLMDKVEQGAPSDACVLCGSASALLHPVGRAWACSRCHTPVSGDQEGTSG